MKNLKRRSAIGICFCSILLIIVVLSTSTVIFIPFIKNDADITKYQHTCAHFPLFPHWGLIVLSLGVIILLMWLIKSMYTSYYKVFGPLSKCEDFVIQLAENNIPEALDIKSSSGTKVVKFANSLNLLRDRILTQANRLKLRQNREVKLKKSMDIASELKSIIVSRLAPDIRTPLQTLEGINDILRMKVAQNKLDPLEVLDYTKTIQHSIITISNLILRIIKFAESTNADSEVAKINTIKTADLINDAIHTNKFILDERDVKINNLFSATMPETITVANEILNQALIVLTRAIFRASEHGEDIFIYCDSTEDEVLIHVRDNKNANSRENLSEIFNDFDTELATFKDYNALSTTILGLFFVKFELEAIGGSLDVVSNDHANNETIIRFNRLDVLPQESDENSHMHITKNISSSIDLMQQNDDVSDIYNEQSSKHTYKILLGEDNKDNAHVTKEFLKLNNFEIYHLDNSLEILSQIENNHFDAIILTNSMRHKHLLKMIKKIRTSYKNIPIVVLVSKINNTKEFELRNLDVTQIMLKPINFISLAHKLRQFIKHARKLDNIS